MWQSKTVTDACCKINHTFQEKYVRLSTRIQFEKHTDLGSMFALSGFSASSDNFTSSSPYLIPSINCLPVLLHHLEDTHKLNKQLPFLFCLFVPVVWRNTRCRHSFGNEQFEKLPYHLSWLFWLAACWLLSLQHLQAGAVIENWFLSKEYLFMQNSSLFFPLDFLIIWSNCTWNRTVPYKCKQMRSVTLLLRVSAQ